MCRPYWMLFETNFREKTVQDNWTHEQWLKILCDYIIIVNFLDVIMVLWYGKTNKICIKIFVGKMRFTSK